MVGLILFLGPNTTAIEHVLTFHFLIQSSSLSSSSLIVIFFYRHWIMHKSTRLSLNLSISGSESGKYQPDNEESFCLLCIPGQFNNKSTGEKVCRECDAGYYAPNIETKTACEICPLGYKASVGSPVCDKCGAGTYVTDGTECLSCPKGWARSGGDDDASRCLQCGQGEQTVTVGSDACSYCDEGRYGNESGVCTECPHGQLNDIKGAIGKQHFMIFCFFMAVHGRTSAN